MTIKQYLGNVAPEAYVEARLEKPLAEGDVGNSVVPMPNGSELVNL